MQPYRIAITSSSSPSCLDAPVRACESPPPPPVRWAKEALVASALVLVGASSVWAANAVARAGHVEIAPNALAHVRAKHRPAQPPARSRSAVRRETPAPTAARALLVGVHDPKVLVDRAKKLEGLGLDLSVVDVPISDVVASSWPDGSALWPASWLPIYDRSRTLSGFEIVGIPATSPLRVAGFADGDRVLAVDGYDFRDDALGKLDAKLVLRRGWVVVEVERGEHRVVLSLHWRPSRAA